MALDLHCQCPGAAETHSFTDIHTCNLQDVVALFLLQEMPLYFDGFRLETVGEKKHVRVAKSHLLHSKWVSLLMVQVFLQVEKGVEEYVSHPAAL